MILRPDDDFAKGLVAACPRIAAEGSALPKAEFEPWPLYQGYLGEWLVFPLFLHSWPPALGSDFTRNQERCPDTTAVLRRLGARAAAFSRMEPGCHILPHRDAPEPGVRRYHLGLEVPRGAFLRVGNQWEEWTAGAVLEFDGQIEHEAVHHGRSPRLVLLADRAL